MSNWPPPPGGGAPPWTPGTNINLLALLGGLGAKHYIHISFSYPSSMDELEAAHRIQPIINTADDWLKYADNCWIIWTSQTPQQWYDKFAAVEELKMCSILIVKQNLSPENRAGQLPQWVWDWIQKSRT